MPVTELQNFRSKYPDYNDLDDSTLANMLAKKYPDSYGDLPSKVSTTKKDVNKETQYSPTRDLGLGTRAVIKGALSLPVAIADPISRVLGLGSTAEVLDKGLSAIGLPEPATPKERIMSGVQEFAAGAMSSVGASALAKPVTAIGKIVQKTLTAQPIKQVVGGATGGAASSIVKEAGGGELAQTVAGLAGGMAPYTSVGNATKRIIGVDSEKVRKAIDDFAIIGETPTIAQATGDKLAASTENMLRQVPMASGVIDLKDEKILQGLENTLEALVNKVSKGANVEKAGRTIERGITGETGFINRFKEASAQLFTAIDERIPKGTMSTVKNTVSALNSLVKPITGAENLTNLLINPKIAALRKAVIKDTGNTIEAQKNRVLEIRDELYKVANEIENIVDVKIPGQQRAEEVVAQRLGQKALPAAERNSLVIAKLEERKRELQELFNGELSAYFEQELNELKKGRQLPYEALKQVRTRIGYMLDDSSLLADVPKSQLKRVYGALTEDMKVAAKKAGAGHAFELANRYYKAGMERIESIKRIIDKDTPGKIFRAAMSGSKDDAVTIQRILNSLGKEDQKIVAAAVVKELGMAKSAAQNEIGDVFSVNTFLTNWDKIKGARAVITSRLGKEYANDLEQIAKVARMIKESQNIGKNFSGTAGMNIKYASFGGILGSVAALVTGNVLPALGTATTLSGARLTANLMTSPKFVRWLAKSSSVNYTKWNSAINSLANSVKNDNSQEGREIKKFIEISNETVGKNNGLDNETD